MADLIVPCNYDSAFQDTGLHDTFVSGLVHESTRQRLLTEKNEITFMRAAEIALSLETASVQARQMQGKSVSVHRVSERRSTHSRTSPIVCHRCGGSHLATVCCLIKAKCWVCGKIGHIAKVGRFKATTPAHSKFKKSDRTHAVMDAPRQVPSSDTTLSSDVQSLSYTLFPIISRSQPIMLFVKANGCDLRMELDTGAAVSIISKDTFKSVFKDSVSITPIDISLCTYLGNQLPVLRSAEVEVMYPPCWVVIGWSAYSWIGHPPTLSVVQQLLRI